MHESSKPHLEPHADYVAEDISGRFTDNGQTFDEHGIRIGRWEAAPWGDDGIANLTCCVLPCVTMAQISHRLGGSYAILLLVFGIPYGFTFVFSVLAMGVRDLYQDVTVRYRYGTYIDQQVNKPEMSKLVVFLSCLGLSFLCNAVVLWITRARIRRLFHIPGNIAKDLGCAVFFGYCALSQMATHVKSFKPRSCCLGPAVDSLPAYEGTPDADMQKTTNSAQGRSVHSSTEMSSRK